MRVYVRAPKHMCVFVRLCVCMGAAGARANGHVCLNLFFLSSPSSSFLIFFFIYFLFLFVVSCHIEHRPGS